MYLKIIYINVFKYIYIYKEHNVFHVDLNLLKKKK